MRKNNNKNHEVPEVLEEVVWLLWPGLVALLKTLIMVVGDRYTLIRPTQAHSRKL